MARTGKGDGDLASALLIKAAPIRVEISRDYRFDTDQIAVKSVYGLGGAVVDPVAAAYLVSANS